MEKLKSRSFKIIEDLDKKGKVKTLTPKQSHAIDHELALELKKIKNDFLLKEKNSRAFVAKLELTSYKI